MIDILRGLTPSFFMSRMRDPLVHGFWCVGYVLNGEDKVATFFQMESGTGGTCEDDEDGS